MIEVSHYYIIPLIAGDTAMTGIKAYANEDETYRTIFEDEAMPNRKPVRSPDEELIVVAHDFSDVIGYLVKIQGLADAFSLELVTDPLRFGEDPLNKVIIVAHSDMELFKSECPAWNSEII